MVDSNTFAVGFNEGLNPKDAANLQAIKDLMAKKALEGGGDTAAATAFAQLLEAETRRHEISVKAAEKMSDHAAALTVLSNVVAPPGEGERTTWQQAVTANRQVNPASVLTAA
jgi:hypothetical protein